MTTAIQELETTLPQVSLDEAIRRVREDGARTIVTLNGVPFGVVPVDEAQYMEDLEDEYDARVINEIKALDEPTFSLEDVIAEFEAEHGKIHC